MSRPKISILMPVYNSSEFLDVSISSVLNQTFEDFELIAVDDGSTDNSLEILEGYARKDNRLKIFSKENGRSATSRNMALREATGEYITFFDPDDYLSLNHLELSYKNAIGNGSDIVIFKGVGFYGDKILDKSIKYFHLDKVFNLESYENFTFNYKNIKDWVLNKSLVPWAKLYKKEFLDSYDDFVFDEGVSFEDVPFHVKAMLRAKRISFVNETLYFWRSDNPKSVTKSPEFCYDIFKIMDILYDLLTNECVYDDFELEYHMFEISHSFLYVLVANSEDYLTMAKDRVKKIDPSLVPKMYKYVRDRYGLIMYSNNMEEYKINYSVLPYKNKINNLNMELNKVKKENSSLVSDLNGLKDDNVVLESNLNKLKEDNKKLKTDLNKSQKLNKEILSSNSWKITRPLRKIRNFRVK